MVIDRVVEFYRKACGLGLFVSLSIHHLNGQVSFSFCTFPCPDLAGQPGRHHCPKGGRRQRKCGRRERSTSAAQPPADVPSSVRSPPVQSAAVEQAVAAHTIVAAVNDSDVDTAAGDHPRRRCCNPPPFLMELRRRNQSFS